MSHTEVKVCKIPLLDSPLPTHHEVLPEEMAIKHSQSAPLKEAGHLEHD